MSDQEAPSFASPAEHDSPNPAREALDEPHLDADELKKEIGNSEQWDEDSHGSDSEAG
jgi:hypothetical protein